MFFIYPSDFYSKQFIVPSLAVFTIVLCSVLAAAQQAPRFENPAHETTAVPYLTLDWTLDDAAEEGTASLFEVERALSEDFSDSEVYYYGPDRASFVSGLAEGTYYFRVRQAPANESPGPWSDSISATVEYESLALALSLFVIGGVVSLATIVMVIVGDRKTRREEAAAG